MEPKPVSVGTTFTGVFKWSGVNDDHLVTLSIDKEETSEGLINFSGHDVYVDVADPETKCIMQVQGEINTNDDKISFSESHPSNAVGAITDGSFTGTITADLHVVTVTWSQVYRSLGSGDLRLTLATPDTPPADVLGEVTEDALSAQDISWIADTSLILLRDIDPSYPGRIAIFQHRVSQRKMETDKGTVLWGNLFSGSEIFALTNLAPQPAGPFDYPPQYLCLFVWKNHKWTFRQFLGNAYGLELHYRKDHPSAFLQATRQTGRYDGDYLSWYYDETTGQLVRTHFEDWGPFYLVGNYLCLTNGYERTSHEEMHSIYAYKDGKKGALLASVDERDTGPFEIDGTDQKTGETVTWSFNPRDDNSGIISVRALTKADPSGDSNKGEIKCAGEFDTGYFLELLTGLSSELLNEEWVDELPQKQPLQRIPIQATGSADIVKRFQWPLPQSTPSK